MNALLLISNNKLRSISIVCLCLLLGICVPLYFSLNERVEDTKCLVEPDLRLDCLPHLSSPKFTSCQSIASCCWFGNISYYSKLSSAQVKCYWPGIGCKVKEDRQGTTLPGYRLIGDVVKAESGQNASFEAVNEVQYKPSDNSSRSLLHLNVSIQCYDRTHFRIAIYQEESAEWLNLPTLLGFKGQPDLSSDCNHLATVDMFNDPVTGRVRIRVKRTSSGCVLFDTKNYPFIYTSEMMEMTTELPSEYIYGLGQTPKSKLKHSFLHPNKFVLYSKHSANLSMADKHWSGAFPFYMGFDPSDASAEKYDAYGICLMTTHPVEASTTSLQTLTIRLNGGIIDVHFFLGPSPLDVVDQLTEFVGRPSLPPYWALGYHMCRSTESLLEAHNITKEMTNRSLPFESDCGSARISSDVAFSVFSLNFTDVKEFVEDLHAEGYRLLHIQSPQIHSPQPPSPGTWNDSSAVYTPYEEGLQMGIFVRTTNGSPYVGHLTAEEKVAFPDFFNEKALEWLEKQLRSFQNVLDFDGVAFQYNSPLEVDLENRCSDSPSPPMFTPGNEALNRSTLCLEAVHQVQRKPLNHWRVHNVYGHQHLTAVQDVLSAIRGKRVFTLSESTFLGSGSVGGHWGGAYQSTWAMLNQSIVQMLEMGIYGIPMTGAPVCGFLGVPEDEELCLRWYQVAALQPLMMSHRGLEQQLLDPVTYNVSDTFTENIAYVLNLRYSLLPYMYTLLHESSLTGSPMARPLFFEFPDDPKTFDISTQYMLGDSLLVSPALSFGTRNVRAYFPKGMWYYLMTGEPLAKKNPQKGGFVALTAFEYQINVHIRGGSILPLQEPGANTRASRSKSFNFTIALDEEDAAEGTLYLDDGESILSEDNNLVVDLSVKNNCFRFHPRNASDAALATIRGHISTLVNQVKILGVLRKPSNVTVNSLPYKESEHLLNQGVLLVYNLQSDLLHRSNSICWQ